MNIENLQPSTRVILNTSIMYVRLLFSVLLSLYSTRLILDSLGESDYGLFTLIGGIITMLAFIKSALSITTQRYISYYKGLGDFKKQQDYFSNSFTLHLFVGVLLSIFILIVGVFLFKTRGLLNIQSFQVAPGIIIYIIMVLSLFISILFTPFNSLLIAHENIFFVAIVQILHSILNVLAAFLLYYFQERLVVYGIFILAMTIIESLMYFFYTKAKYQECVFELRKRFNLKYIMEMLSFAGWNVFSTICVMLRYQGIAVLFNHFFGTVINAAYGLANQIGSQVLGVAQSLQAAINPQIMKSEGANERTKMIRLSMISCKFRFFLMALMGIPLIFEMPLVLNLWLKNVPDYTIAFSRLMLLATLVDQLSVGLVSINQAINRFRKLALYVDTLKLSTLFIAFILLKRGFSPETVLWSYVIIEAVAGLFRVFVVRSEIVFPLKEYFKRVVFSVILPVTFSITVSYLIVNNYSPSLLRLSLTCGLSALIFSISFLYMGLFHDEKTFVKAMFLKIKSKFVGK